MGRDVRKTIVQTINQIRTDSGRDAITPEDEHSLTRDIGLDSLDLAVLVVTLEKELGIDPFREGGATAQSLADLVAVYERALAS